MIELLSFCIATFRKLLAKVTRPAAALPSEDCVLYVEPEFPGKGSLPVLRAENIVNIFSGYYLQQP